MANTFPIRSGLLAGAALIGLTGGPAAAEDVKVGALMAMTGDLQAYGEGIVRGVYLAAAEANAAGGVLDGEVTVSVGDTQTAPQPAIDAAKKLVSIEGVAGIVGALSSGNTIPVATSVTGPEGVVMISPASTSPAITTLDDGDFLFRTAPSDAFQGIALAEVVQGAGYTDLAIIYVNNDYGEGLNDSFTQAFEAAGGTISGSVPYEPGKPSYRGELQQLASDGAEALVVIGYPENGVTILRQALEEGFFTKFVFTDGMKAPEIVEQVGAEYLNGSIGTVPQAITDSDSFQAFQSLYEAEYGELPPKPYIDGAYDATFVLLAAIQKAGTTDGAAVRDALREVANPPGVEVTVGEFAKAKELIAAGEDIDYVGASGSINFDEAGDVAGTFAEWTIEDGEIKNVRVFEPGAS